MRTFKTILNNKLKNIDNLELDKINLDVASASIKHINVLKDIFRNHIKEFNDILTLKNINNIIDFNEEIYIQSLYSKINAIINTGDNLKHTINIHNKLFPDELVESLTGEELYILQDLKIG